MSEPQYDCEDMEDRRTITIPRAQYEALMALVPFVHSMAKIRKPISDEFYRLARSHVTALHEAGIMEEKT
jgi:hypothetical protein